MSESVTKCTKCGSELSDTGECKRCAKADAALVEVIRIFAARGRAIRKERERAQLAEESPTSEGTKNNMATINLTVEQKTKLKSYLHAFSEYLKSDSFAGDQAERTRRVFYFQKELPQKINDLSEAELDELIGKLWASQMWGNKLYLAQKVIADNGIEKLRSELKFILNTAKPYTERYEHFLKEIKGLGPASLTEMLCYIQPQTCGIWNQKARQAIKILGLQSHVNPDKYRLFPQEYETFNEVLQAIARELSATGIKDVDLLFVDFFLYEVTETTVEQPVEAEVVTTFDHDEIRDLIENIGIMLGFDTDTEKQIGHGARVDVIWRARIANLGLVTYVFEVHKSGSIDSLLLNLQKAKSSPTVQKVIAVSDETQLERMKRESEGLPEEFRRTFGFWRVEEVQKVGENLQSAIEIINRLGLVQGSF